MKPVTSFVAPVSLRFLAGFSNSLSDPVEAVQFNEQNEIGAEIVSLAFNVINDSLVYNSGQKDTSDDTIKGSKQKNGLLSQPTSENEETNGQGLEDGVTMQHVAGGELGATESVQSNPAVASKIGLYVCPCHMPFILGYTHTVYFISILFCSLCAVFHSWFLQFYERRLMQATIYVDETAANLHCSIFR